MPECYELMDQQIFGTICLIAEHFVRRVGSALQVMLQVVQRVGSVLQQGPIWACGELMCAERRNVTIIERCAGSDRCILVETTESEAIVDTDFAFLARYSGFSVVGLYEGLGTRCQRDTGSTVSHIVILQSRIILENEVR